MRTDRDTQRLIEDYVAGEMTSRETEKVRQLCLEDGEFLQALSGEARFSQVIRLAVQQANATMDRSDFVTRCVESAMDLMEKGTSLPLDGGVSTLKVVQGEDKPSRLMLWLPLALAASVLMVAGVTALVRMQPETGGVSAGPALARVTSVSPGVSIDRSGKVLRAAIGSELGAGDMLQTGRRQEVELAYAADGSRLVLGDNSKFEMGAVNAGRLAMGHLEAEVAHQAAGRAFTLETPHAQAMVVGTRFNLGVNVLSSRLDVFDGIVKLVDLGGREQQVGKGEYSVAGDGAPLAAYPASVDGKGVSRLRSLYHDGKIVFEDDFETGGKGWLPMISADPLATGQNRHLSAVKSGAQVRGDCVGVIDAGVDGRRSKMMKVLNPAYDNLIYGVWGEYSKSLRSYSVEFKVIRISGIPGLPNNRGFHGLLAGFKSPTHREILTMVSLESERSYLPVRQQAKARMEYVVEMDESRNVVLDTKIFFDGHMESWFVTRGAPNEFGGEIILGAANGGILVDDVVIRRLVPARVGGTPVALYMFNEGKGDRIQDVSGVGEPMDMVIGNPGEARWLERGLDIGRGAKIQSMTAKKMASAWRKNGSISVEWWERPRVEGKVLGRPYGFLDVEGKKAVFTCSQFLTEPSTEADLPLYHYVMTLTLPDGQGKVTAGFYRNGMYFCGGQAERQGAVESFGDDAARIHLPGGAWQGKSGTDKPWDGECHMMAIHSRALTPGEIWQNYQAGLPETQKDALGVSP